MLNLKLSPQIITVWIAGFSLVPRLLSPAAYLTGTVNILLFWIAMLVLLPELVEGYESNKKPVLKLPKITITLLTFCCLILVITYCWKDVIYEYQNRDPFISNLRRSLYLIHPLICLSWYPLVNRTKSREFIRTLSLLTIGCAIATAIPLIFGKIFLSHFLNELTASISAKMLSLNKGSPISVEGIIFYDPSFTIKVGAGCSSSPQLSISLLSILVFAICCKIKSIYKLSAIVLLSTVVAFLVNALRISILAHLISIEKIKAFDFWHDGLGSLIFSFIVMTLTSLIYYLFWCRENPESASE